MLRALLALAVAGLLIVGGPVLDFDVARAQDGQEAGLPLPKNPACKDCWDHAERYTHALNRLNALRPKQQAANAKYEAFKAKFGGAWGSTPEQGAEAAELRAEVQSVDNEIAIQKAVLEWAFKELQRCNARKCFEDPSLTPVPPVWFEANEPCAACRPLANQVAYLKYYVKSLQTTVADAEREAVAAYDAQIAAQGAANEAKQASQKDIADVKKYEDAERASKEAKDLREQFRKLKGQLDVLEQTLAGASALFKKLEEELAACRKQQCRRRRRRRRPRSASSASSARAMRGSSKVSKPTCA
jgi:DNA repair exonuclease SbcCD ATPase subunit